MAPAAVLAMLSTGCNPTVRYRVLSLFFDGVPPPVAAESAAAPGAAPAAAASTQVAYREHGPYAAHLCNACHDPSAFNSLVVPKEQLCFQCHDLKLDKKYIHGPLASGGCVACHDPHSSQYPYLLVSASDTFCFYCHDRETVAAVGAHGGIVDQCTTCHNPHMSDKRYLLR